MISGANESQRDPSYFTDPKLSFWNRLAIRFSISKTYQIQTIPPVFIKGFDASSARGEINFTQARNADYKFVILKATEGNAYTDPRWDRNWRAAVDNGFYTFEYHFYRSHLTGVSQADYHLSVIDPFLVQVDGKTIDFGDLETQDGAGVSIRQREYRAYDQRISQTIPLRGPYSSWRYWGELMGNIPLIGSLGWFAHWTLSTDPLIPVGWPMDKIKFWQWGVFPTWYGEDVPGVNKPVDCDRFLGTEQDLRDLLGLDDQIPDGDLGERVEKLERDLITLSGKVVINDREIDDLRATVESLQSQLQQLQALGLQIPFAMFEMIEDSPAQYDRHWNKAPRMMFEIYPSGSRDDQGKRIHLPKGRAIKVFPVPFAGDGGSTRYALLDPDLRLQLQPGDKDVMLYVRADHCKPVNQIQ